jgi:hypothetical protein
MSGSHGPRQNQPGSAGRETAVPARVEVVCAPDMKQQARELVKLADQSTAHHARRSGEATRYTATQLNHLGMLIQDLLRHIEAPIVAQEDDVLGGPLRGPVPMPRWRFAIESIRVDKAPGGQPQDPPQRGKALPTLGGILPRLVIKFLRKQRSPQKSRA